MQIHVILRVKNFKLKTLKNYFPKIKEETKKLIFYAPV